MPRGQQILLINREGGGKQNSPSRPAEPSSGQPLSSAFSSSGLGNPLTNFMLLPSLSRLGGGGASSSEGKPRNVEECLRKVREAERSLQRSLHLAREAVCCIQDPKKQEESGTASPQEPLSPTSAAASPTASEALSKQVLDKDKARAMFDSYDKDSSGKVSVQELRKMMDAMRDQPLTDSEFADLKMKLVTNDTNQDGQLSFEEYYNLLSSSGHHKVDVTRRVTELQQAAMHASQTERMTPEQFVNIRGVPQSSVIRYLRKELDETGACLQLPWAALMFLFFFLAVRTHFDLDRLHSVDQAITWDIKENANFAFTGIVPFENGRMGHKNIEDVNSIADFWSFVSMGIVPIFWPTGWDVNEHRLNTVQFCMGAKEALRAWGGYDSATLNSLSPAWGPIPGPCPEKTDELQFRGDTKEFFGTPNEVKMDGTYLLFHRILGGVRMRQERVPLKDCPDVGLKNPIGMCTGQADFWLRPEIQRSLEIEKELENQPGGETVHLLSGKAQDFIRNELRDMENKAWFSPQTRKIELLFTTYNMNEDMMTATYILFFLNRGGHIFKNVEPVSFYLDPYHNTFLTYLFDILWASLCLKLVLEESWEIIKHWRQLGIRKGTVVYMTLANMVDWVSIGFTIYLINFWMSHLSRLGNIREVIGTVDLTLQGNWQTYQERANFFELTDDAVKQTHDLRTALALYPFVIVSRFFKAFSSQPRLAMVTRTFAKASCDIFHFGVVFFTVFIIFAFSAMILWGQELEDFANEGRSFHTTFRILLGDFDWEPMTVVGRSVAYLWFWGFVWLVNLIMLNMLLAIIMDVYTDVKSGSADAETLWSQSVEIFYRTRDVMQGRTVSLSKVLKALDPTDLDDGDDAEADPEAEVPLFPLNFAGKVPKMSEEQAFGILVEAQKLKMNDERDSDTLSEALIRITDIDERTKLIQEQILRLIQVQQVALGESGGGGPGKSGSVVL